LIFENASTIGHASFKVAPAIRLASSLVMRSPLLLVS
jgi:hypothetical protein